ncbi:MAG: ABC transporter substrate-binding protein [Candidatus Lokiarchaeota archaeon]|nr:ABC transporter substrate-binding protein [Candidatus Lokiarchaeota archaeon]
MDRSKLALALVCIVSVAGIATALGTWLYVDGQRLRVGYIAGDMNHAALYHARVNGMFYDAGLDLKFTAFGSEQAIMDALHAGELDIALVGLAPAVLYNQVQETPITVLAAASVNGSAIVVRNDTGINSTADLVNKTIAIPGASLTQDLLLHAMLNASSVKYGGIGNLTNEVDVVVNSTQGMLLSLNNSQIDAIVAWECIAAIAVNEPDHGQFGYPGKYLANSSGTWPNHPSSVVVARTALLGQPALVDAITRFLHVHAAATVAVAAGRLEDPRTSAFYLALEQAIGIGEGDMVMALGNTGFTCQPSIPLVKAFIGNMSAFGLIAPIADLDGFLASFYNTTLLNRSLLL